ncbi:MAG TPA: hypothetical protein K8V85_09505 [Staphylococcus kloosii]|uniref:Uncharacterized protein n=1 Tax=Staphylococcus kloosii TaxID=29384 RepID=A0A921GZ81_9STAP|nr:hypothetical protein [Staphylococcus kloosii]HJF68532.1 hypothetical protein [Staphylococcus kloosii]
MKQEEIEIAIESKFKDISELVNEYEERGGKITYLAMINYDDSDSHGISANGYGEDIKNLIFSNENINKLATGYVYEEILGDLMKAGLVDKEDENNEQS